MFLQVNQWCQSISPQQAFKDGALLCQTHRYCTWHRFLFSLILHSDFTISISSWRNIWVCLPIDSVCVWSLVSLSGWYVVTGQQGEVEQVVNVVSSVVNYYYLYHYHHGNNACEDPVHHEDNHLRMLHGMKLHHIHGFISCLQWDSGISVC